MTEAKKTVLVIDDEPDTLTFLGTLLEDAGYRIQTAVNGKEALEKVEQERPDLITLDITMPEKSGVRFYRDIKENDQYKDIPVIMVTGVDRQFEKFISSRRQVPPPEGYVAKPVDQQELLKKIQDLLS